MNQLLRALRTAATLPTSVSQNRVDRIREEERPPWGQKGSICNNFGFTLHNLPNIFFPTEKAKPPPAHMLLLFLCVCCATRVTSKKNNTVLKLHETSKLLP